MFSSSKRDDEGRKVKNVNILCVWLLLTQIVFRFHTRRSSCSLRGWLLRRGLVVCEMLTNKIPFEDIHEFAIMHRVGTQGERPELPDRPTAAALLVGWAWDVDKRRDSLHAESFPKTDDDTGRGDGGGEGGKGGEGEGGGDLHGQADRHGGGGKIDEGAVERGGGLRPLTRSTSTLHESLTFLVRRCWAQGAEDRPAFTEVVEFLEQLSAPTGPPREEDEGKKKAEL